MEEFVRENIADDDSEPGLQATEYVPADTLNDHIQKIEQRVDRLDKKIGSMKLSSVGNRAAKVFSKEIIKIGMEIGYSDLSDRVKTAEDDIFHLGEDLDEQDRKFDSRISENEKKVAVLTYMTRGLLVIGTVQLIISGLSGAGKLTASAVSWYRRKGVKR